MNEKLASFPEFAEAIGMTRVSTCDEARAFMKAYNDYRSIHPWFDEDLLSKDELLRQWEAEGLIDLEPEFLELAGVPDNVNLSVVRTVRQPTKEELQLDPLLKGTTSCTAVRIAPLLFLTAAHCLPNVQRDVQLKTFQMWIKHVTAAGTYKYYVSGSAFPPTEPFVVDGMVLPGFAGTNDAPRDLAVFRIREGKEALLADNVPETIARISSRTPKLGDPVDALGWGRATETDNLEDTILRISDQPLTIPQPVSDVITIPYVGVSAPNSVRICNGDSGGPLRLAANENVVGLLSASQFFSPSLPTQCAKAGDAQYWTRVDVRINDIKKMMSTLQSGTMKAPYRCFFHSAVEQPRDAENIGSYFDCARQ